jgi:predicted MFS family arabinose efflux permease
MYAGVRFLALHPVLRSVLLLLVATCVLVRPYTQLLPAYAAHVVHTDARGLGVLLAASGVGAIGGSFITAILGAQRRGTVWIASALLMSAGVIALGAVHDFTVAVCVLAAIGLAVLSFAGSSNVLLQTLSAPEMRGRAISVFSMIILGIVPLGSLLLGSLATLVGLQASLITGGAVGLLVAAVVWITNPALRSV